MAKRSTVTPIQQSGMSHIIFPSVTIAEFSRVDPSSGEVKFHCELPLKGTDKLFDLMDWQMPADTTTEQGLEGKLEGGNFIFTAKDKLVSAEVDVEFIAITKFKCLRLEIKGKKGKGFRRELRFTATFGATEPTALAKLEAYQFACDNAAGQLKVNYIVQPVQQELVPDGVQAPIEAPMFEDEVKAIKEKMDAKAKTN